MQLELATSKAAAAASCLIIPNQYYATQIRDCSIGKSIVDAARSIDYLEYTSSFAGWSHGNGHSGTDCLGESSTSTPSSSLQHKSRTTKPTEPSVSERPVSAMLTLLRSTNWTVWIDSSYWSMLQRPGLCETTIVTEPLHRQSVTLSLPP
jgi:hypothetical protein